MKIIDDIYDILAQNDNWATQGVKDNITSMIDYVDDDREVIVFRDKRGHEFELQLVKTYAPAPKVTK